MATCSKRFGQTYYCVVCYLDRHMLAHAFYACHCYYYYQFVRHLIGKCNWISTYMWDFGMWSIALLSCGRGLVITKFTVRNVNFLLNFIIWGHGNLKFWSQIYSWVHIVFHLWILALKLRLWCFYPADNKCSYLEEAIRRSNMVTLQLYEKDLEASPGDSAAASILWRFPGKGQDVPRKNHSVQVVYL